MCCVGVFTAVMFILYVKGHLLYVKSRNITDVYAVTTDLRTPYACIVHLHEYIRVSACVL